VPAGFADGQLPVGLEFMGRPYDEGTLFRLAYGFEQATRHRRAPVLG
jgi:Asp-tRNA(Asn)/Glu-tRNA(Gln) amidotransferase A subunit family amidase